jgi:hypothetical protein
MCGLVGCSFEDDLWDGVELEVEDVDLFAAF